MSWSYDASLTVTKDQVRFLIRDTNTLKQMFQDEEIEWTIAQAQNIYTAAAELCEQLVSIGGNIVSKKIDGLALTYDVRAYVHLSGFLRARGMGHQIPYAGGISDADKVSQQEDTDWVTPKVGRGLFDNPAAPAPNTPRDNPLTRDGQ